MGIRAIKGGFTMTIAEKIFFRQQPVTGDKNTYKEGKDKNGTANK